MQESADSVVKGAHTLGRWRMSSEHQANRLRHPVGTDSSSQQEGLEGTEVKKKNG